MYRILFVFTFLALTSGTTAPLPASSQVCPDPASLAPRATGPLAHVRYLADDALEGRAAGSDGARCAADYLVDHFTALGLRPAAPDGSWFQTFPLRVGSRIGEASSLRISEGDGDAPRPWEVPAPEWAPYGFSASTTVEAPLVVLEAGFEETGADAGIEVAGRIVVLDASAVQGRKPDPHRLASDAAARGAVGLVVLLAEGSSLPEPGSETRPTSDIPVVAAIGTGAQVLRVTATRAGTARLHTVVEPVTVEARNVVALLPGSDAEDETVVVGAHYDHLGWGGPGSLAPDVRAIHNGADDNASGTAALLEVAEALARGPQPGRSVLFVAFTAEERGLLGSARYVAEPLRPLDGTVAMVNMDMVGRLRDNVLTVYGTGTAEEWEPLLEGANEGLDAPLELSLLPDGFGPSDHQSFYGAGIPVLHFFTNTHTEYHRPEDDWQTIDAEGIRRVAALATAVTRRLAGTPDAEVASLTPVRAAVDPHGAANLSESSSGRGYGPYLGTIPDMSPLESGVRITGVREGSPAEAAGLLGGDVIVELGGREITDLYAYTYALRDHAPGDEVEVVVLRDGERVALTAVLGERR